jgi:alkanesulfonate monooxygenase SsuD/methylene tetrahydromethanopterin reductase-like flavin-dependent oxidoreductase (luciferase family)
VRFGVVIPTYGRFADPAAVLQLISVAEELGYDGAWFSDHVAIPGYATTWVPPPHLEALATCCLAMGRTTRLRCGVDVLVAAYRHPLVLAAMAGTAARLSGGRLVLGVGVGYLEGEFAALGLPYQRRGDLADEMLTILRRAWTTSGPLTHTGGQWSFADVRAGAGANGTPPPLWIGGNATRALRRAALLGDGWHPLWPSPEGYALARQRIRTERTRAEIDRPFTFSLSCPLTSVVSSHSRGPSHADQDRRPARPEYGYVPPIPRATDGRPRFVGTPDELTADIDAYAAAGVEHLTVRLWTSADGADVDEVTARMTDFATHVANRFG